MLLSMFNLVANTTLCRGIHICGRNIKYLLLFVFSRCIITLYTSTINFIHNIIISYFTANSHLHTSAFLYWITGISYEPIKSLDLANEPFTISTPCIYNSMIIFLGLIFN